MTINDFLAWLLGSGGSVMAASWILERIVWFQDKSADFKEWFFFAVASAIALAAYAGVTYIPQETIDMLAPYFTVVSGIFVTIVVGQAFHKLDKRVE